MTIVEKIEQWSTLCGLAVNKEFTTKDLDKNTWGLIEEEHKELLEAETRTDIQDGLGDLYWVIHRAAMGYGVNLEYILLEDNNRLVHHMSLIGCDKSCDTKHKESVKYELEVNLARVTALFDLYGFDLADTLESVYQSNMSKLCKTEEEAIQSIIAYGKGEHPNKEGEKIFAIYEKVGEYYVVKRKDTGKVLKSINFKEPVFNNG